MLDKTKFFIDGAWVDPDSRQTRPVINPATEQSVATIALATGKDVDRAATAAARAFEGYSATSIAERLELLQALRSIYKTRRAELAHALSAEMGAPIDMALGAQTGAGRRHIRTTIRTLRDFTWEWRIRKRNTTVRYEPIGVCGLITPWNWPMNQVTAKVLPALAAGCTMVLKPSELAPLSAMLFAEMVDEAGFPAGVFNLINGAGDDAGAALSAHPLIDMVSFTGSTRAGKAVSIAASATVKRVMLELGGKSPNLIFADANVDAAVKRGVRSCFYNTGQSCNAPTRMLVEAAAYDQALARARSVANATTVGDPAKGGRHLGPVASVAQYDKVQRLIESGIAEGARLLAGGPGKADGMARGYFVRPTIFADVGRNMRIAREEIFGPVLCMMPFGDEAEAIDIANDTPYGLSAYVHTEDKKRARRIARRLRAGMVQINGASHSSAAPFGGYKQSGNGREFGEFGLKEYLEVKAISGL